MAIANEPIDALLERNVLVLRRDFSGESDFFFVLRDSWKLGVKIRQQIF